MEVLILLGFGAGCVVVGLIAGAASRRRERRALGGDDAA